MQNAKMQRQTLFAAIQHVTPLYVDRFLCILQQNVHIIVCFHPILAPSKAHNIGEICYKIPFREHFFDFYRLIFSIWMQAETDFRYQRIEKSAVSGEFCITSRPFVYKYAIFVYAANHAKRITKQRFRVRFCTFWNNIRLAGHKNERYQTH